MQNNKINILIENAIRIIGAHSISYEEIKNVESKLNLHFSDVFKQIITNCSYEYFSNFHFLNFGSEDNESVISATLGAYSYFNYSGNYIVLYKDDAGILLMTNISKDGENIYWCAIEDCENVIKKEPLQYHSKFFPSFADFFEYLLDEEEKLRAEIA
jgi:hypothetical protein